MNRTQAELDKLRAAHPEKWAELIAAGFKPQRAADIIQHHADEKAKADAANPPSAQALARVQAAQDIVLTHLDRARLSKAELDKLVTEVRAQFPELQIEIISLDAPGVDATHEAKLSEYQAEIEQLKKDKAVQAERIAQLEDANAGLFDERNKAIEERDRALGDLDACKGVNTALQTRIENALAAKSIKAAHEALS